MDKEKVLAEEKVLVEEKVSAEEKTLAEELLTEDELDKVAAGSMTGTGFVRNNDPPGEVPVLNEVICFGQLGTG